MKKYIIRWDYGHGDFYDIVEAEDKKTADQMAYQQWKQDAEDNAVYEALDWSEELAQDYGV